MKKDIILITDIYYNEEEKNLKVGIAIGNEKKTKKEMELILDDYDITIIMEMILDNM